ncbi:MAG TPA: efflux RND transporter periplasmic adaptor subunit [Polyangiales bacterium]|nr:efflux RND transporter periplasmic adaptor subunit [Polyangiales bacterium]
MRFRSQFPNRPAWILLLALGACTAQARDNERLAQGKPAPVAAKQPAGSSTPLPPTAELATNPVPSGGSLELSGDLKPDKAADLSFKITGQLQTVRVVRGERVKRGDVLAGLSDAEARAQLAQADAAVAQARAQLELAKDSEARATSLVAANAVPGSQATAVRLQVAIAEAALQAAMAQRELAATALANHVLKAPFDGQIVRVPDGVGQIVNSGTMLFRLEALDRLVLRATVSEADVDRIRVGDEVSIDAGGKKAVGKVRVVLRSLDAASRRAPVEVIVPNDKGDLIAGSYVRATCRAH